MEIITVPKVTTKSSWDTHIKHLAHWLAHTCVPHQYSWAPTVLKACAKHCGGHPDTQMNQTVIPSAGMNSQSTRGMVIYSKSLLRHSLPSTFPLQHLSMALHGFLFWIRNSLRARILSWWYNLVGLPFTPTCIIISWTEWALDKCLPNGGVNKIENRKAHKCRHYTKVFWKFIGRREYFCLAIAKLGGGGRNDQRKCHRGVNPKVWPRRKAGLVRPIEEGHSVPSMA